MLVTLLLAGAWAGESTVDIVDGGLMGAARVLSVRYGTPINYEGFPLTAEGLHYTNTLRPDGTSKQTRVLEPWAFQFAYESTGDVKQAAEAALGAWNSLPSTLAKYTLRQNDSGSLEFVPSEVLTAAGKYEPIRPLLDTSVEPSLSKGTPTQLFFGLLADFSKTAGVEVRSGNEGWGICDSPDQVEREFSEKKAAARQFLDEIRAMCSTNTTWHLIWVTGEYQGWHLTVVKVLPDRDRAFNQIPAAVP